MSDEELKQEIHEMKIHLEVIAGAVSDQKAITIRMMAHQQAHLAAIRDVLVRLGEDRTKLGLSLPSAYETALALYADQLQAFQTSGDVIAFLRAPMFPDELLGN